MNELEILKTLQPHDHDTTVQSILTLGFAPDSHHLASGGQKGALLIWDVTAGTYEELEQFVEPVESLAYSPDGSFLAYSTLDSAGVEVKNLLKRAKSPINLEVPGSAPAIAFHPGGEYLVVGADDLEIYHVKERESVTMYNPGLSICVAISPDGAVLANGNDGGEVLLWDVHLGPSDGVPDEVDTPIRTLKGHPDVVTSVAFSPDNARLASSGNDGSVCLWDVASGKLILTSAENGGIHSWVAFSPDGKWLATTGAEGRVALWDISTATKAYEGRGHTGDVNVICFAPDSTTLASGGTDGKVVLWRVP